MGNAAGWAGTIDEVALYRKLLTADQLTAQRANGAGFGRVPYTTTVRSPGGLYGYWRLDDPKGKDAINSGGQAAVIYVQVERQAPGLINGDRDTAARFEGFGSDVIVQPPPRAQLSHGMTLEAWATVSLGGGRALVGKNAAYALTLDRGGHWQASVVIHKQVYAATAHLRAVGSASALGSTEALLAVLAALGMVVGGLTHVMQSDGSRRGGLGPERRLVPGRRFRRGELGGRP